MRASGKSDSARDSYRFFSFSRRQGPISGLAITKIGSGGRATSDGSFLEMLGFYAGREGPVRRMTLVGFPAVHVLK